MIIVHVCCRVLFGPNHLYVFHHPQDEAKNVKEGKVTETPTYDTAQEEIAKKAGFMDKAGKSEGLCGQHS